MTARDLASRLTRAGTELGDRFLAWTAGARAQHPGLSLDLEAFARHAAAAFEQLPDLERAFSELAAGDLFLAAGCSQQDPAALALFEERYMRPLRCRVSDIDADPDRLDELKQLLRERLLVPQAPGGAPRISAYAGRGALGAWVQIAARRLALSCLRQAPVQQLPGDAALDAQLFGANPELDYVRLRYAREFREAFAASLQELGTQERLLLRLHLVDGVSLTRIAVAYRVSQSTISRRLQRARELVALSMKQRLEALLGVTGPELESLLRLIDSRLELSLARALESGEERAASSAEPTPSLRSR